MTRIDPRIVARLLEQLARQILDEKHLLGLGPVDWAVLRFFSCGGRGRVTAASVSRYLDLNEVRGRQALSVLAGLGLVSALTTVIAGEHPTFVLTEAGASTLKQDPVNRLALSVSEMEPTCQAQLAQLVEQLQDRVYRSSALSAHGQAIGTAR